MNEVNYNDTSHSLRELHHILDSVDSISLTSPLTILGFISDSISIWSPSEYFLILTQLVDSPYSIELFIRKIYKNDHLLKDKIWISTREQSFLLIEKIIKQIHFTGKSEEIDEKLYFKIIDLCFTSFSIDPSNKVKKIILSPLAYSLERYVNESSKLLEDPTNPLSSRYSIQNLYNFFFKELMRGKSGTGVKGVLVKFLGRMINIFPNCLSSEVSRFLKSCLDLLRKESISASPVEMIIANVFLGLNYVFYEFPTILQNQELESLYLYISKALDQSKASRYDVPKSALKLIASHASLFEMYIIYDTSKFFDQIQILCNHINDKVRKEAFPAMESILSVLSKYLCESIHQENQVFSIVLDKINVLLFNKNQLKYNKQCAIFAIGGFASPIEKYKGKQALKDILTEQFIFTDKLFYGTEEESNENIHLLPSLLITFSNIILKLDYLDSWILQNIEKLLLLIFSNLGKHFITPKQQYKVFSSISKLLISIALKPQSIQKLISNIFPQGLSMALTSDISQSKEIFLSIWIYSLKVENYTFNNWPYPWNTIQLSNEDLNSLLIIIYDQIIESILQIIYKLDIRLLFKDEIESTQEIADMSSKTDLINHARPSNEKDFEFFGQLILFFSDFMKRSEKLYMWRWIERLTNFLCKKSIENPFLSGFFKLLHVIVFISKDISYFDFNDEMEDESLFFVGKSIRESCFETVKLFCKQTIGKLHEFKGELLLCVVEFLLSVPLNMLSVEEISIPLNLAFKQGLSYLPLANIGLSALESWIDSIHDEKRQIFLEQALPNLNPYLSFKEEIKDDENIFDNFSNDINDKNNTNKKENLNEMFTPLRSIQLRIVRMLANLGSENIWILNNNKIDESLTSWDYMPRIKFRIPFRDYKPELFFDSLLPRVIDLAENSGNRNTKIAACEFLYSIVILMIGTNAVNPNSKRSKNNDPTNFFNIYTHIFPILIKLAVDNDPVCRNIFEPFIFQIVHWFTQTMEYEQKETMSLLDCILESLCSTKDGAIRDLCASLLNEYLLWSIKHDSSKNYYNVKSLFERLFSYANHPQLFKRLGAVVAFNSMYRTFRENTEIVSRYVLDWLHIASKCLIMIEYPENNSLLQKQVITLLQHIEKIIIYKSSYLIEKSEYRIYHLDLNSTIKWLFINCSSSQIVAQEQFMKLFSSLVLCLPNINSSEDINQWILNYFKTEGFPKEFVKCIDDIDIYINNQPSLQLTLNWILNFSSSLRTFTWLISIKALDPEYLFIKIYPKVINHIISFLKLITLQKPQDYFEISFEQERNFYEIKSEAIIAIFKFITSVIANNEIILTNFILDDSNKYFFLALLVSIIHPHVIGFNTILESSRLEIAKTSEILLKTILSSSFGQHCTNRIIQIYSATLKRWCDDISLFNLNSNQLTLDVSTVWFRGLRLLNRIGILQQVEDINTISNLLLDHISSSLSKLDPSQIHIAQELLELCFELGASKDKLLQILVNDLKRPDNQSFLKTFYSEVMGFLSKNLEFFIPHIINNLGDSIYLQILTNLSSYFSKNIDNRINFVNLLLNASSIIEKSFFKLSIDQKIIIIQCFENIRFYSTENLFCKDNSASIGQIYIQTIKQQSSSKSDQFLSLKLICMQSIPDLIKSPLLDLTLNAVDFIVSNELPVTYLELTDDAENYEKYIKLLDSLLQAMLTSSSISLSLTLLKLFRWNNHPQKRKMNNILHNTLSKMIPEDILSLALECFSLFENISLPSDYRSSVIQWVSVECFSVMNEITLKTYFKKTINSISNKIEKELILESVNNIQDVTTLVCSYNLLEYMFRTLPSIVIREEINSEFCKFKGKNQNELKGNELTSAVLRAAFSVRKSKIEGDISLLELRQSSYNVLAGAVMCTQNKEKLYNSFLFSSENRDLWDHIVDKKIEINFPIETNFNIFIQAISKLRLDTNSFNNVKRANPNLITYLSSQYLTDSNISGDAIFMNSFYIPGSSLANYDDDLLIVDTTDLDLNKKEKIETIDENFNTLEMDLINQNPCMATVLRVIDYMVEKFPDPTGKMPEWMKEIHFVLNDPNTHINIKYFLTKIILNRPTIFQNFCHEFFENIVYVAIYPMSKTRGINYFLRDICLLFLKWNDLNPGNTLNGRASASNFVEHLMKNAPHSQKIILKNNLELIKIIIEKWKPFIKINRKIVLGWIRYQSSESEQIARTTGLQLVGILLANDIPLYEKDIDFISESKLYECVIKNIHYLKIKVSDAASEICGMILQFLSSKESEYNSYELFSNLIYQEALILLSNNKFEKFLRALSKISLHHESFIDKFLPVRLLDIIPKLVGKNKELALQLILLRADHFPELFIHFKPYLISNIESLDENVQLITLQIVHKISRNIDESSLSSFIEMIFESSKNLEKLFTEICRIKLYEILMWIYDNAKTSNCKETTRNAILVGLMDSSENVWKSVLSFWDHESRMSESPLDRLDQTFKKLYSSGLGSKWLQHSAFLLLQLAHRSPDFNNISAIFPEPLSNCEYKAYEIDTFEMGMASTFSLTQTQKSQKTQNIVNEKEFGKILATQSNSFSLTLNYSDEIQSMFNNSSLVSSSLLFAPLKNNIKDNNDTNSSQTLSQIPRRRFPSLKETSKIHVHIRRAIKLKQEKEAWNLRQKNRRQKKLNLYRSYKAGELPFIQISYKDLIEPLQALCIQDVQIAKLTFILIAESIFNLYKSSNNTKLLKESTKSISNVVSTIIEESNEDTVLINSMLSLSLSIPFLQTTFSDTPLVSASFNSYNIELGILVYESMIKRSLHNTEKNKNNNSKKSINQIEIEEFAQHEAFIRLARLYSEIGEEDILRGILENYCYKKEISVKALSNEREMRFNEAHEIYKRQLEENNDENDDEEFTFWEFRNLHCLKMLTKWDKITSKLYSLIQGDTPIHNLDHIWEMEHIDVYLPLLLESLIKQPKKWTELKEFISISMKNEVNRKHLEKNYPHYLAVISLINNDIISAKVNIISSFSRFLNQWSSLSLFSIKNRKNQLNILQSILEIEEFLSIQHSRTKIEDIETLLNKWNRRLPDKFNDPVSVWDDVLVVRLLLLENLSNFINTKEESIKNKLLSKLNESRIHILQNATIAAQNQGNYDVSKIYLKQMLKFYKSIESKEKHAYKFKKLESIVNLWILKSNQENYNSSIGSLSDIIQYMDSKKSSYLSYDSKDYKQNYYILNSKIYLSIANKMHDHNQVQCKLGSIDTILNAAFENLKLVTDEYPDSKNHVATYKKMASFCDMILENKMKSLLTLDELSAISTKNTMLSLKYGDKESIMFFPKIIKYISSTQSAQKVFNDNWKYIPIWIYLSWFSQIIPLLNGDEGNIIINVLEAVSKEFKQGVYFPWKISKNDLRPRTEEIHQRIESLSRNIYIHDLERIVKELNLLTNPELRWLTWKRKLELCLQESRGDLLKLWPICFDELFDKNIQGSENKKYAEEFIPYVKKLFGGKEGKKILQMNEEDILRKFNELSEKNEKYRRAQVKDRLKLSDFSPFLSDYMISKDYSSGIALPGQFEMIQKNPDNESIVYISSFDPNILVLKSIRRPKRVTIRGNDEKEYNFLVKGGEDLRQDQRIEQLFSSMNSILLHNSVSRKKELAISTYKVIPMTKDLGVLEWLSNTETLKTMIERSSLKTNKFFDKARLIFEEMLKRTSTQGNLRYISSYNELSREFVSKVLVKIYKEIPENLLKSSLESISASKESFFRIRDRFGKSLCTFNICSYILGIGDRHLDNFLLDITKGNIIGIDFGHAFGSATEHLPIPDLTPFRLTRQLISVFHPLTLSHETAIEKNMSVATCGIFIENMTAALVALRESKESLYSCMEIFVKEPLVDWLAYAKSRKDNNHEDEDFNSNNSKLIDTDLTLKNSKIKNLWYPERKLLLAKRKLNLWNPSSIVISDLEHNKTVKKTSSLNYLASVARGHPRYNLRARMAEQCESVRNQVEALIELATDPTVLTRNYIGWSPYI